MAYEHTRALQFGFGRWNSTSESSQVEASWRGAAPPLRCVGCVNRSSRGLVCLVSGLGGCCVLGYYRIRIRSSRRSSSPISLALFCTYTYTHAQVSMAGSSNSGSGKRVLALLEEAAAGAAAASDPGPGPWLVYVGAQWYPGCLAAQTHAEALRPAAPPADGGLQQRLVYVSNDVDEAAVARAQVKRRGYWEGGVGLVCCRILPSHITCIQNPSPSPDRKTHRPPCPTAWACCKATRRRRRCACWA